MLSQQRKYCIFFASPKTLCALFPPNSNTAKMLFFLSKICDNKYACELVAVLPSLRWIRKVEVRKEGILLNPTTQRVLCLNANYKLKKFSSKPYIFQSFTQSSEDNILVIFLLRQVRYLSFFLLSNHLK